TGGACGRDRIGGAPKLKGERPECGGTAQTLLFVVGMCWPKNLISISYVYHPPPRHAPGGGAQRPPPPVPPPRPEPVLDWLSQLVQSRQHEAVVAGIEPCEPGRHRG